jgi:uncharacterized small protein (TIGR04563 family)
MSSDARIIAARAERSEPAGPAPSSRPRANKQCLSFPSDMLKEIEQEAARLERSVSWVVQRAWKLARVELKKTDPT